MNRRQGRKQIAHVSYCITHIVLVVTDRFTTSITADDQWRRKNPRTVCICQNLYVQHVLYIVRWHAKQWHSCTQRRLLWKQSLRFRIISVTCCSIYPIKYQCNFRSNLEGKPSKAKCTFKSNICFTKAHFHTLDKPIWSNGGQNCLNSLSLMKKKTDLSLFADLLS